MKSSKRFNRNVDLTWEREQLSFRNSRFDSVYVLFLLRISLKVVRKLLKRLQISIVRSFRVYALLNLSIDYDWMPYLIEYQWPASG